MIVKIVVSLRWSFWKDNSERNNIFLAKPRTSNQTLIEGNMKTKIFMCLSFRIQLPNYLQYNTALIDSKCTKGFKELEIVLK